MDGEWFGWEMKSISFIFAYLFFTCGLSALGFKETKKVAEGGDANAQLNLGVMYYNGEGVPQDYKEAVKWYRMSAEQGHDDAQKNLVMMYNFGEGVPQDLKEAVKWCRMAAEQGHAKAQFLSTVMVVCNNFGLGFYLLQRLIFF